MAQNGPEKWDNDTNCFVNKQNINSISKTVLGLAVVRLVVINPNTSYNKTSGPIVWNSEDHSWNLKHHSSKIRQFGGKCWKETVLQKL